MSYCEIDPAARRACIKYYGLDCTVCGFNFEVAYGSWDEQFIAVHDLRDPATTGKKQEVDPIADLRPVCRNCHAVLHQKTPPVSIEQLQKQLGSSEARRILKKRADRG